MINRTVLVGRLTKDPELKYGQTGTAICRFTLAVNRTFQTQDGQTADFIQVVCFKKQAENAANYLKKGSLAGVEGRIQTGSYDGQDGKRVYTTEVISDSVQFLEPKNNNAGNGSSGQPNGQQQQSYTNTQNQQQNGYNGQQQQPNYQQQQQQQQSYQQQPQQQNYTRTDNDPFSAGGGSVELDPNDLPF